MGATLRRTIVAFAFAVSLPAFAQETKPAEPARPEPEATPAPEPRRVDPRAEELVRKMSDLLARTPSFALDAEEIYDELPEDGPRQQLTTRRRVAVKRPDHAVGDATGDALNRAFWYDGKTLSVLDREKSAYVSEAVPATIDGMLEAVFERTGLVIPLADFLYADAYAALMESVESGTYLGVHEAAGVPCHHLAFEQESIDWQLWIDAGEKPLPRKLVIAYKDEEGVPQYTATIRKWNLSPSLADALFRFEPPAGAEKVEPPARPKEQAQAEAPKEEKP